MATTSLDARNPRWMTWTGRILSVLPMPPLIMSAVMKFALPPEAREGFSKLGWSPDLAVGLGILEVACILLYLIPQTAVLGAILLTGYLGGAIATHVRVGDAYAIPIVLGVVLWLGVFLREPRLRTLLPLRR